MTPRADGTTRSASPTLWPGSGTLTSTLSVEKDKASPDASQDDGHSVDVQSKQPDTAGPLGQISSIERTTSLDLDDFIQDGTASTATQGSAGASPASMQPLYGSAATFARLASDCMSSLDRADHLPAEVRAAAKRLFAELCSSGRVQIPEGEVERLKAVAGVQWAIEDSLRGTELIITPERATPLRTHDDSRRGPGQKERELALRRRLDRGDPLHLVFCPDGAGTPEQNAAYRRDILDPSIKAGLPLHEHLLPHNKNEFPVHFSGAFIASWQYGTSFVFAIRAAQVDKTAHSTSLSMWFGPADKNGLGGVLEEWSDFLVNTVGLDVHSLARSGGSNDSNTATT